MKSSLRTAAARALFYFAIWVVLMPSAKLDDLAVEEGRVTFRVGGGEIASVVFSTGDF